MYYYQTVKAFIPHSEPANNGSGFLLHRDYPVWSCFCVSFPATTPTPKPTYVGGEHLRATPSL